jgi:hypothetical protein
MPLNVIHLRTPRSPERRYESQTLSQGSCSCPVRLIVGGVGIQMSDAAGVAIQPHIQGEKTMLCQIGVDLKRASLSVVVVRVLRASAKRRKGK